MIQQPDCRSNSNSNLSNVQIWISNCFSELSKYFLPHFKDRELRRRGINAQNVDSALKTQALSVCSGREAPKNDGVNVKNDIIFNYMDQAFNGHFWKVWALLKVTHYVSFKAQIISRTS